MFDDPKMARSLGEVSLESDAFDLDIKINEGYQAYASELLRVSLLAIGGVSTVWLRIYLNDKTPAHTGTGVHTSFVISFAFLVLSSASALVYKYTSADSLAYHLTALRRIKRGRPASGKIHSDREYAKRQQATRTKLFELCKLLLMGSIVSLILGVVAFGSGLLYLMK